MKAMGEDAHKKYHEKNRIPCANSKEMISLNKKPCDDCQHSWCDMKRRQSGVGTPRKAKKRKNSKTPEKNKNMNNADKSVPKNSASKKTAVTAYQSLSANQVGNSKSEKLKGKMRLRVDKHHQ